MPPKNLKKEICLKSIVMNRRELIRRIALAWGASPVGVEMFLAGCDGGRKNAKETFSEEDIAFFDDAAEAIIPSTDTPGAKEAGIGKFIAHYAQGCYSDEQLAALKEGINRLNEEADKKYNHAFKDLTAAQRIELLTVLDKDAKQHNKENKTPHYFTLMKQLALFGFFTSKQGMTQALKYNPVPGGYWGCEEYHGEQAWA